MTFRSVAGERRIFIARASVREPTGFPSRVYAWTILAKTSRARWSSSASGEVFCAGGFVLVVVVILLFYDCCGFFASWSFASWRWRR
ncbi:MAG: hypothetical protein MPK06_08640 [Alphaproteobacteria bacterium]|nr:hypothetical protein [Alphaproteobacteria bacterium]MDA8004911.1 hypothetical protein [Alphaproteobacteria bacterium]MDA8006574.1 hypothetical protein [Alphaproteobacteria bacterium]